MQKMNIKISEHFTELRDGEIGMQHEMQHEIKKPCKYRLFKIGASGFEPATSRPPAVRATKLRHTPQQIVLYQIFLKKQPFFQKLPALFLYRVKRAGNFFFYFCCPLI